MTQIKISARLSFPSSKSRVASVFFGEGTCPAEMLTRSAVADLSVSRQVINGRCACACQSSHAPMLVEKVAFCWSCL